MSWERGVGGGGVSLRGSDLFYYILYSLLAVPRFSFLVLLVVVKRW